MIASCAASVSVIAVEPNQAAGTPSICAGKIANATVGGIACIDWQHSRTGGADGWPSWPGDDWPQHPACSAAVEDAVIKPSAQ